MAWVVVESSDSDPKRPLPRHPFEGVALAAVFAAGMLAMVATWLLVTYYPVRDDDGVVLGLIGFFFVLFVMLAFAAFQFRRATGPAAIKTALLSVFLGLVGASIVGSLPVLWSRLVTAQPWVKDNHLVLAWLYFGVCLLLIKRPKTTPTHLGVRLLYAGGFFLLTCALQLLDAIDLFERQDWIGRAPPGCRRSVRIPRPSRDPGLAPRTIHDGRFSRSVAETPANRWALLLGDPGGWRSA